MDPKNDGFDCPFGCRGTVLAQLAGAFSALGVIALLSAVQSGRGQVRDTTR